MQSFVERLNDIYEEEKKVLVSNSLNFLQGYIRSESFKEKNEKRNVNIAIQCSLKY
jgi:hypothetical protein